MDATPRREKSSATRRPLLRRDIYDALTRSKGATTIDARAALFDLDRATVVRIEQGQIEPRLGNAMKIAHRLGVTIETLWLPREQAMAA